MSNFPEMEYKSVEQAIELEPDATSLTFLQRVYRNASLPLSTRMRAAGMALQFEHPKLGVSSSNHRALVLFQMEDFAGSMPQLQYQVSSSPANARQRRRGLASRRLPRPIAEA